MEGWQGVWGLGSKEKDEKVHEKDENRLDMEGFCSGKGPWSMDSKTLPTEKDELDVG